jgi:multidrug efflux pump subunit AcrA (membrane-fusion protein)
VRADASFFVMSVLLASPGACNPPGRTGTSAARAPKDEVWLRDDELAALRLTTEEVKLEEIDQTLPTVGPVVSPSECPAGATTAGACIVAAIEQSALATVRVGSAATARTTGLLHDTLPGHVAWIAGALDRSGRTVKVACVLDDKLGELHPGQQVRVEIAVGVRPAFAVSGASVVQTSDGPIVFTPEGTTEDGRHRFARVAIHPDGDSAGPWIAVTDLKPGSLVVKSGTKALASMLAITAL